MPPRLPAPDTEQALVAALTRAGIRASPTLEPPYPALALYRIGGERALVADTALVQLDSAGSAGQSKSLALGRLEDAIGALRDNEGATVAGVTLSAVRVSAGPAYLPDVETGAPRYVATLVVTARTAR